jgi:diguanylate cyclase (GGDEF)-like protein
MDSFTLIVASAVVGGSMAASMLLLYRANARQPCLLNWSLSGLCFMATNIIGALVLKYQLGHVLLAAIGNTFYIAGHAGILIGIRRHLGLRPRYDLLGALALAVPALHALSFAQSSLLHRLVLFTPIIVGINLATAWLLWRQPDDEAKPAYRPLMALELSFTALMCLRAGFAFMGSEFLQISGAMLMLVFLSVTTMSCALIVTHHQELALRRASLTDVLTGWLNRRALHDTARREFHRSQRTGTPLFFLTFDIDHFKTINDRYGHSVGDAAICHVTTLSARALRGYDAVFRIGGEEFAVLVNGGSLDDVQRIAERLRELVADTPLLVHGLAVPMTVSVGLAAARPGDLQWEDVLRHADEAMYQAKQNGRNRVGVYGVDGAKDVAKDVAKEAAARLQAVA